MTPSARDRLARIATQLADRLGLGVPLPSADEPLPPSRLPESPALLARFIDHTLLKADATPADVQRLCDEARRFEFHSVCVNSSHVARCAWRLEGSRTTVCAVVGFPLGAMSVEATAFETRSAVRDGATEIDTVLPVGMLRGDDPQAVLDDLRAIVQAAGTAAVKVILETAMLSDDQKVAACLLARMAGARFVKTSTGFGGGGATTEDIELMRHAVGGALQVKASGGIRSRDDALRMIAAGATRLGTSASLTIVGADTPEAPGTY